MSREELNELLQSQWKNAAPDVRLRYEAQKQAIYDFAKTKASPARKKKDKEKTDKDKDKDKGKNKEDSIDLAADSDAEGGDGEKKGEEKEKKGKKKKKRDPNAPKRPPSGYMLWSVDARPKLAEKHPDLQKVCLLGCRFCVCVAHTHAHTRSGL